MFILLKYFFYLKVKKKKTKYNNEENEKINEDKKTINRKYRQHFVYLKWQL